MIVNTSGTVKDIEILQPHVNLITYGVCTKSKCITASGGDKSLRRVKNSDKFYPIL